MFDFVQHLPVRSVRPSVSQQDDYLSIQCFAYFHSGVFFAYIFKSENMNDAMESCFLSILIRAKAFSFFFYFI
jgi:hypothetical protein